MAESSPTKPKNTCACKSIHTSCNDTDCPVVEAVKCCLQVPPAATSLVNRGVPQYYATDELANVFGRTAIREKIDDDRIKVEPSPIVSLLSEPIFAGTIIGAVAGGIKVATTIKGVTDDVAGIIDRKKEHWRDGFPPVTWSELTREQQKKILDDREKLSMGNSKDPGWSRLTNFLARHIGCEHDPPNYYLHYGYYYCTRFRELSPSFITSDKVVAWSKKTSVYLQRFTEEALEVNMRKSNILLKSKTRPSLHTETIKIAQCELEINDEVFSECMYAMHPLAYFDGGFQDLGPSEIFRIGWVLDIEEANRATGAQGWTTIVERWNSD